MGGSDQRHLDGELLRGFASTGVFGFIFVARWYKLLTDGGIGIVC